MELLLGVLIALSSPVFYIIGLVVFIQWLVRGGKSADAVARAKAAADVRAAALGQSPKVVESLMRIAGALDGTAAFDAALPPGAPAHADTGAGVVHRGTTASWEVPAPEATKPATGLNTDIGAAFHNMDNINLILYLGAFLIVVSAGIFVGYNFEVLSGVFKTMFLGLFAAAFYAVGLMLYLWSKKLRPAGVTFTGIGLVVLPLVGLAAYNFTSLHEHGHATWFVTSAVTLVAYIITLLVTRQTYIAYLMAFTSLSLFESSISLFDVPVYWYGWGMGAVSILLLTLSRTKLFWEDAAGALLVSANVFVPVSLLLSMANTSDHGLAQLGVTIALAGAFYAAMAQRFIGRPDAGFYWGAALVSLPAALGIGLWDTASRLTIALVMLACCSAYLAIEHTASGKLSHTWRETLAMVTGLLPLAGILVMYDRPGVIAAILAGAVLVNADLALRLRQSAFSLLAILSLLALPFVLFRGYLDPALPWSAVSIALLAEVPALVWWTRFMRGWPDSAEQVGVFAYVSALALAVFTAAVSSVNALSAVAIAVAVIFFVLSYTEGQPLFVYGEAISLYVAALQQAAIFHLDPAVAGPLLFLLAGAGLYAFGYTESDARRSEALRYSGLAGPFLGSLFGLYQETQHLAPVAALAGGGALLWAEARRQAQPVVAEVAGGVLVLAFNWFTSVEGVTQTQAYTLPWAAYIAYLAYRRRDRGHEAYDGLVGLALAVLTLPLAGQALADDGQVYGLILIGVALALVFLGMSINYRLLTIWGAATLVAEVLYQLRDFFYALPKYVISATLGLALLAVAIVLLSRRKGGD